MSRCIYKSLSSVVGNYGALTFENLTPFFKYLKKIGQEVSSLANCKQNFRRKQNRNNLAQDLFSSGDRNPLYVVFSSSNLIQPLLESFMFLPRHRDL